MFMPPQRSRPYYDFGQDEEDEPGFGLPDHARTPDFNPAASQSPVTDAFEASLNNGVDDPRAQGMEDDVSRAEEAAAHQQWLQGMIHAASQIGHGIAGAKSDIDTRAGEMFVGSAQMRAKAAQEALERYNQAKSGAFDQAATRAGMAGQDANFRAGREDAGAQRAHQSAALAQDQSQFEAAQRQQRQMAQQNGGMTEYQRAQLELEKQRIQAMRRDPSQSGQAAMLQDPGTQQDMATLDHYMSQGGEPPGTGLLERFVPQSFKGEDTIKFQQAGQGMARRLLMLSKQGREPSAAEIQNFTQETGLLSPDPETVKAGYARIKAQLQAYEQQGQGQQAPEQDDWQDYEPGQGGGMFR